MVKYSKRLLTAKEVADKLQLNVITIYNLIKKKRLTAIQIGNKYRIEPTELDNFIESNKLR